MNEGDMKAQYLLLTAAGFILMLWMSWGLYVIYSTERPPYEVIQSLSADVELRQYEAQTWISTTQETDNAAFPVLASYIFGGNKEGRQVSMTAPVITGAKMSFILPQEISADNAPRPDGQAIDFSTVPARKLATLEFAWWTDPVRVEQKTSELLDILQANGVETTGRVFLMRYNDPWAPPFLRRNEVAIEAL
jgi:hypothetical protein